MRRAVIMAGGEGTRLRPYTAILPKPLMPIGDRPVLDIVIRQLRAASFDRITIPTGYLAELIEAFFRDGQHYELPIDYFREYGPLGTVGALALIEGLDEPFLVMNGDVLTDMEFDDATAPERLTHYVEKPTLSYEVSMGVYCFDPRVLAHIEPNARLDFPDLILRLLALGERVEAWRPDSYWLDLGRHDDYELALQEFDSVRHRLLPGDVQAPGQP
jgi:NDP-mannose synthase